MIPVSRRASTVRQLADQFELDLDDTLVTLWDAGFDSINDVDDLIPARDLTKARKALGLISVRQMRTLAYWEQKLNFAPDELRTKLVGLGIEVSPKARLLPKGALAKLKKANFLDARVLDISPFEDAIEVEEILPPEPRFEWRTVGAQRDCAHISVEEVLQIHEDLEKEFQATTNPIFPPGVRSQNLLESAVYRAQTSLGGEAKYQSSQMVAAALLHSLIHNHPFYNGNKRTALVTMLASLDRNSVLLTCSEQDLFRYVIRVAQHRIVPTNWSFLPDRELIDIAEWICRNSRALQKGERAIKWRELRRRLTNLNCTVEEPLPGNKIKIRRTVTTKGRFGRQRKRDLVAHAWYGGEGREVHTDHLHYIRKCLELDDEAGYDSAHFYGTDPREPDEFIAQYRTILKRLAKL